MIDVHQDNKTIASLIGLLDSTTMFMEKAGQDIHGNGWTDTPTRRLRLDLLCEEFDEYVISGEAEDDLEQTVDGLLDVIVVAWGSLLAYIGEEKARNAAVEVARSNLDKVVGEGLPIFREDGKVLKPSDWRGPDIKGAIA